MLPHNPAIAAQLRQLIFYHLDNDLNQNALFFASRLHALDPRNSEAAHLLAWCHLRLGQLKAAYDYSRDKGFRGQHLGCAYVFAQACLGLERYQDGILALERSKGHWAARNSWSKANLTVHDIDPLLTSQQINTLMFSGTCYPMRRLSVASLAS